MLIKIFYFNLSRSDLDYYADVHDYLERHYYYSVSIYVSQFSS